jgi:hypothetical protein
MPATPAIPFVYLLPATTILLPVVEDVGKYAVGSLHHRASAILPAAALLPLTFAAATTFRRSSPYRRRTFAAPPHASPVALYFTTTFFCM